MIKLELDVLYSRKQAATYVCNNFEACFILWIAVNVTYNRNPTALHFWRVRTRTRRTEARHVGKQLASLVPVLVSHRSAFNQQRPVKLCHNKDSSCERSCPPP